MASPESVLASVLHGPKDLRLEQRTLPPPQADELQVKILSTGLCGSDLHYYSHYRNGDIIVYEPLTLGHESIGRVKAIGSSVPDGLKVGDTVALEVGLQCNECTQCRSGRYNICPSMRFRSSAKANPHFQGTLQQKINHPASKCYKLPSGTSLELGALLEPFSVAIHASRRGHIASEQSIVIFGAGAVGLLCAAACKYRNVAKVVMVDVNKDRLEFAMANGFADGVVVSDGKRYETTEEKLVAARDTAKSCRMGLMDGADACFECTGVEGCAQAAIFATKPGGKILLIGMGNPVQTLPISAAALHEIDLIGVFRYANCYEEAIQIATSGDPKLPRLEKLVTQKYKGFEKVKEAFETAGKVKDDNGDLVIKVVVDTSAE